MTEAAFRKVTAFVTREVNGHKELLTFLHPVGGRQLPAGSVEEGEEPFVGVQREVFEETGVSDFIDIQLLDVEQSETAIADFLCVAQNLRSQPSQTAPLTEGLPRGYRVEVTAERDAWLQIAHHTYDLGSDPPVVIGTVAGWVPRQHVSSVLERYHYHLTVAPTGPKSWMQEADGHLFQVVWVPLTPLPRLVAGQQQWLEARRKHL